MSGMANNMNQLILARALQGVGAGGIQPLAFILIGEMFDLKQRAKMQGFFSGVWGFSSIVGPLLGGWIVDYLSWRWVFYINIIPGLISAAVVAFAWKEYAHHHKKPSVDYAGAGLLTTSVVLLLLGLTISPAGNTGMVNGSLNGMTLIAAAGLLFLVLLWVERRAVDPILPISLFRERFFSTAIAHGLFAGCAMFGSISYIPLFIQSVLGTSATQAGVTISPMLLGWVIASILAMRIITKTGYRRLVILGTSALTLGAFLMTRINMESNQLVIMGFVAMMGIGMGISIPAFLIAVQTNVERRQLGTATSTLQFSRSMGGTLGVSIMGAALSARLATNLQTAGLDASLIGSLIDPQPGTQMMLDSAVRTVMSDSLHQVFIIAFIAAMLGLLAVLSTPHKELGERIDTPASIE